MLAVFAVAAVSASAGPGHQTLLQKNAALRKQLVKEREETKALRKIAAPILSPTPEGNKRLARAYFGDSYECAKEIIDGESAWDETVWNREGSGAYGLGQARPRSKMLKYGADAYTNPLTQLIWFEAYAKERYGSVCGASAYWNPTGSW